MGVLVWAIVRVLPRLIPPPYRDKVGATPFSAAAFLLAAFFGASQIEFLYAVQTPDFNKARGTAMLLGVLFIALGTLMPRVRRNPFFGVRTAWTLTSDENWLRTHRVAGYTFVLAGASAVFAGAFAGTLALYVALPCMLAGALAPAVYSYLLARTLPPEH
jgi:uncharacterized membrane protein